MPCSDILQTGIFDYPTTKSEKELHTSFKRWFTHNKFQDKESSLDGLLNAGISLPTDIGPIPLIIDGKWGAKKRTYYSDALSDIIFEDNNYKEEFFQQNFSANSTIILAWKDCMLANRQPLFAQALYQELPSSSVESILIKVKIQYISGEQPDEVYIDTDSLIKELKALSPDITLIPFPRVRLSEDNPFSFSILRKKDSRLSDLRFTIRTNLTSYSADVYLKARSIVSPLFLREFEDPSKKMVLIEEG